MFPSDEEWSWSPDKKPGWMRFDDFSDDDAQKVDQNSGDFEKDGPSGHCPEEENSGGPSTGRHCDGVDGVESGSERSTEPDRTQGIAFLTALLDQATPAEYEPSNASTEKANQEEEVPEPSPGPSTTLEATCVDQASRDVDTESPPPSQPAIKNKAETLEVKQEPSTSDALGCGVGHGTQRQIPAPDLENMLLGRKVLRHGRRGVVLMKPMVSSSDDVVYYIRWEDDDTMEQVDCVEELKPLLCDEFDPNYAPPEVTTHMRKKSGEAADGDSLATPKRKEASLAESTPASTSRAARKRRKPSAAAENVLEDAVMEGRKSARLQRIAKKPKNRGSARKNKKKRKKGEKQHPSKENYVRALPKKKSNDTTHYLEGVGGRWYSKKVCLTPGDLTVEEYFFMDFESDAEWDVERIVDERTFNRRKEFLVKYTGYEVNPGTKDEKGDWLSFKEANELKVMDAWLASKDQYSAI
ncbi:hypothetical protein BSKO_01429 [Bryopsis sp. KO-2023]|nr:hypothetical protein BSKO_01429 [Bryopsis sp. KO-2023]